MKKFLLMSMMMMFCITTYANRTQVITSASSLCNSQSEFVEVPIDTIPEGVLKALQAAYPGANILKAYSNDKKDYKLEISVGDQKATVQTDVNGNWLKI